jgi:hypothetical protein
MASALRATASLYFLLVPACPFFRITPTQQIESVSLRIGPTLRARTALFSVECRGFQNRAEFI